jgi:hypothetical protein
MRAACLVGIAAAALSSVAVGNESELPGASWGCSSAAYFEPVEVDGFDRTAFRALYTNFYADGPGSDIVEKRVRLPGGDAFLGGQPTCWDFNGDGAPDPITVARETENKTTLAVYIRGQRAIDIDSGNGQVVLAPVAVHRFGRETGVHVAYLSTTDGRTDLNVAHIAGGEVQSIEALAGFADPTGSDPRVLEFVRDCGGGPELVLPSSGWKTLDVVRVTDGGLERATLADNPDFSRLVRALECTPE